MAITLPLNQMTVQEKLALMEILWEDLARTPEAIKFPAWHKQVLGEREARVASGEARFIDWEEAKAAARRKPAEPAT
jgi:hypothetical protein